MGLDSVELVMEVEKYFNIEIPDQQAEKIITVQDMVNAVASHLSGAKDDFELRDSIIDKIQGSLVKLNLTNKPLALPYPIFTLLTPLEKEKWKSFENYLGLKVPKPAINEEKPLGFLNRIKSAITISPLYEWKLVTLEQFATAICSKNCATLVDPHTIKSMYEIYVAVMSITVDKIGVDEYEITPQKSFINDLGID